MSKKKKTILFVAAFFAVLIVLDFMVYPKTPWIDQWKRVCVHSTESGYWPPTDSEMDRLIIWLYMRTAIPVRSQDGYVDALKKQIDKYGMSRLEVMANVDDAIDPGKGPSFQFVIGAVHDNILFDRMLFYDQSQGDDATYWITLPGFWKYLDSVHRRINPGYFEATGL